MRAPRPVPGSSVTTKTTFALPDLRGRVPIHVGHSFTEYQLGAVGGTEAVTLADFRGFDTMVEITVLAVAVIGVATLLRQGKLW